MTNLTAGDGYIKINETTIPLDRCIFAGNGFGLMSLRVMGLGTVTNFVSFDQYSHDGIPFTSIEELETWVQANSFKKKVAFDDYFKGVADATTEPVMEGGVMYMVLAPATLPNFKDAAGTAITVTQDDLDAGDVYLIGTDGVFDMQVDATREYVDAKVAGVTIGTLFDNSAIAKSPSSLLVLDSNSAPSKIGYAQSALGYTFVLRYNDATIKVGAPTDPAHATTKDYVDNATKLKSAITALAKIPDPSTATTEQVATLLNQLIDALKA